MDAWDKLSKIINRTDGYDGDTKLFRLEVGGESISLTIGDLRQLLKEGHPDL